MDNRKLLELAPGSRWDGGVIVEADDTICRSNSTHVTIVSKHGVLRSMAQNVIALLHRAGLLDGLLAEAWDEGRACGWDNAMDEAHCERPYPHKNPYRKAGK